ncbi:MAG: sialidase family protein [Thermoplasmata archaeon]
MTKTTPIEEGYNVRQISRHLSTSCMCLMIVGVAAFLAAALDSWDGFGSSVDFSKNSSVDSSSLGMAPDMARMQSSSFDAVFAKDFQTVPSVIEEVYTTTGYEEPTPNSPPFLSDVLVYDDSNAQLHPRIAIDTTNGYLWTAFSHNNGADDDLYIARSEDAGKTWLMNISLENPYNESKPAITISSGTIMVFYEHDQSGAEQRMRFVRSNDSGQTWVASYVDWSWTNDPGKERQEDFNNLDVSSIRANWFHVAADSYYPDDDLRRLSFAWTDDDGDSWMQVYVTSGWHPGEDLMRPVIMENSVDSYMHLAFERWNMSESGFDVIWWVLDHDLTVYEAWTSGKMDGGNSDMYPDIWVRDDYVYLVWQNGTLIPDLSGFYSNNGGDSITARLYITSQNGFAERYPAVYVDNAYVPHISCVNDTSIMYMNNTDVLVNPWEYAKADDSPGNVVDSYRATDILYYAGSPRIIWNDNRRGDSDIFFTALGINVVQYTITKDPLSGIGDILADGVPCTAPCTFDWEMGDNHTLEAPLTMSDPGTPDEKRYTFSSWSDGEARVHNITVGPVATTITAYYDTEFNVTIATDPSGLNVTVDSTPYIAPHTFWWLDSSIHLIEADSPQNIDPWTRYTWVSWSDGGAPSHMIIVSGPMTYTAYYEIECMVNVTTVPVDLDVIVDGVPYITPSSFWWANGSVHNVVAQLFFQISPDSALVFSFWSDGGAWAHDVAVSCPMSDLIAYYNTAWNVSFVTSPLGLDVEVDGLVYDTSTPTYFFFEHVTIHTIGAPSPQPIDATSQYAWQSWSDGGNQTHDINVTAPATYTAYFNKQFLITVENPGLSLNITVDGVEHTSPYSFWCDEGSSFTLGTLSPYQISPTERLLFYAWYDGLDYYPEPVITQICTRPVTYTQVLNSQYLVNITTDPEGLNVEIDGVIYAAPQQMWYEAGETHQLGALSPQMSGDTRAVFSHWSDGGAQYHVIIVTGPETFVAYFDTQYLVRITSSPVTGLVIEVDGLSQVTEYQFWCDAGSMHTINAVSPQPVGPDVRYAWNNWSDGLGQSHSIVCSAPETYTAYFVLQYLVTIGTSPTSLLVEVDSILRTAPYMIWWDDGSVHNIGAPSPQVLVPGSSRYDWRSWNDAGAQYHDIIITGAYTYLAAFELQYNITITSDPTGLVIIADSVTYTTPYEVWWDEASTHTVDVPDPQAVGAGERYIFNSWSDGQPKSHTIIVGTSMTYTAYMDHQYEVTIDSAPVGGIAVTVDGVQYITPVSFWWNEGTSHSISAIEYFDLGPGARYAFASWSDGGPRTHNIIADMAKTLIAYYTLQYEVTITTSPEGLEIVVDSTTFTAPQSFWWDDGSPHTIDIVTPQPGGIGERYVFASWSDGGAQSHQIIASAPETIVATFGLEYEIIVITSPAGLNVSADGVPYTTPTTFWWANGTQHNLSVKSPQPGAAGVRYSFDMWSDGLTISNRTMLVTEPTTFQANFTAEYYLTVQSDFGNTTGEGWYEEGAYAVASLDTDLVLAGQTRYLYLSWSGDATGTDYSGSDPILMNAPKTATTLWLTQHYLTVNSDYGNPQGEGWYDEGDIAYAILDIDVYTISADERFVFISWGGDASGSDYSSSNPILLDQPKTATASWMRQFLLTIKSDYGIALGGGWYDDGYLSTASLDSGVVTIAEGTRAVFQYWSVDASGEDFSQSEPIEMTEPKTARAVWKIQHYLYVNSDYSTISGAGWYDEGNAVIVSASEQCIDGPPGTRYAFDHWSADATGSNFSASNPITMDSPKVANATWRTEFYLTVVSFHGNASGEGWYLAGYLARARLDADIVVIAEGERVVFQQWVGDSSGTNYYQSEDILMDAPKTAIALWQKQHLISFESVPTGLKFSLDGMEGVAPAAFWLDSESSHSLSATEKQKMDGKDHRFRSWSDGGALVHSITVSGTMTITLTYEEVSKPDFLSQWLPWIGLVVLLVVIVLLTAFLLARRKFKKSEETEVEEEELEKVM